MNFPSYDGVITFASSSASESNEAESVRNSNPQTILANNGKVIETGQIWSFRSGLNDCPIYYGRIQKIAATVIPGQEEEYKLHVNRLMATRFPVDVIQWEDNKMPVGCGTFYARRALEIITPDDVSRMMVPQTSIDETEFTILPTIGEIWVIYRIWSQYIEFESLGLCSYDIVEILDDTLDYEVLLLEGQRTLGRGRGYDQDDHMFFHAVTEYKYNEIDGSEPIFTIPKSERLRFSHKVPARLVTKDMFGEVKDLIEVDSGALPSNLSYPDLY